MERDKIVETNNTVIGIVSSLFGIFFGISFGLYLEDIIKSVSNWNPSGQLHNGLLRLLMSLLSPYSIYVAKGLVVGISALWIGFFSYSLFRWLWSAKDAIFTGSSYKLQFRHAWNLLLAIVVFFVGIVVSALTLEVSTASAWYAFALLVMWPLCTYSSMIYAQWDERRIGEEIKLREEIEKNIT